MRHKVMVAIRENAIQLFSVTEIFEERKCHWYVTWRRKELTDIPIVAQEYFTKREADTFVKFARKHLEIQHLEVAPMPALLPTETFDDQVIEAGWEPVDMEVNASFCVGCYQPGLYNEDKRAIEAVLEDMERSGLVTKSLEMRPVKRHQCRATRGRKM
jgi:hypothetical protein